MGRRGDGQMYCDICKSEFNKDDLNKDSHEFEDYCNECDEIEEK